tara:strand:- start:179 stop:886 length:708 start_codon:yes stop_codon:yes gene_type:complete
MKKNQSIFHLEGNEGTKEALSYSYKMFVSLIRILNVNGIRAANHLFPDEFTDLKLDDLSISETCKCFASREAAEKTSWKKGGSILEIGVAEANHAISLIENTQAKSYEGIDIEFNIPKDNQSKLKMLGEKNNVKIIMSDSESILKEFIKKKKTFDSIYIDANHRYYFVSNELELCKKLLNPSGRIVLNDYVTWFVNSMEPSGVRRAVIEFMHSNKNWEIDYYVLNENDISISRKY